MTEFVFEPPTLYRLVEAFPELDLSRVGRASSWEWGMYCQLKSILERNKAKVSTKMVRDRRGLIEHVVELEWKTLCGSHIVVRERASSQHSAMFAVAMEWAKYMRRKEPSGRAEPSPQPDAGDPGRTGEEASQAEPGVPDPGPDRDDGVRDPS